MLASRTWLVASNTGVRCRSRMMATKASLKAPNKRIIVCCDGTWQSSNNGSRALPSNVAKISRALQTVDGDISQVVYYDTGIGTGDSSKGLSADLAKTYQGAFGTGLEENVCEGYNFIVNNWLKGDELYFFGFSRGAYTARALSGLVSDVGICNNAMMDQFWEMWAAYKKRDRAKGIYATDWAKGETTKTDVQKTADGQYWLKKGNGKQWLDMCDKNVNIKAVGVFDTVGSLGWPQNNFKDVSQANVEHGFHNTDISPSIQNAFQALAIDERRKAFGPTLWYLPKGNQTTNLIQCWFPGVHINIGGGSDDGLKDQAKQLGDLEGMSNISFSWMVDRVRESTDLKFSNEALELVAARYMDSMTQVMLRDVSKKGLYRGWGVGPIADSYSTSDFLTREVGGAKSRTPGQYLFRDTYDDDSTAVPKQTNEFIHPVVAHALDPDQPPNTIYYRPNDKNQNLGIPLEPFDRLETPAGQGKGWQWIKKAEKAGGNLLSHSVVALSSWWTGEMPHNMQKIVIPEFKIPPGTFDKSFERTLMLKDPLDLIKATWVGEQTWNSFKKEHPREYADLEQQMSKEYERLKKNVRAWDKQNGFEEDPHARAS